MITLHILFRSQMYIILCAILITKIIHIVQILCIEPRFHSWHVLYKIVHKIVIVRFADVAHLLFMAELSLATGNQALEIQAGQVKSSRAAGPARTLIISQLRLKL
jgi:hypothetical protein